MASFDNITILNGHIVGSVISSGGIFAGSGFGYGINSTGGSRNVRIVGVTISGCLYDGIYVGDADSTTVESCNIRTVGGYGIVAWGVVRCVALECGLIGTLTLVACYFAFNRMKGHVVEEL